MLSKLVTKMAKNAFQNAQKKYKAKNKLFSLINLYNPNPNYLILISLIYLYLLINNSI